MPTIHVIDWQKSSTDKSPLKIVFDPEQIYPGDQINIRLFSAYPYRLESPYGGLSAKSIATENPPIEEVIYLSGNAEITTEYPVDSIVSAFSSCQIVSETTRKIVIPANFPITLLSVVGQKLKLNTTDKLHGSIKLIYHTFSGQKWSLKPFSEPTKALLFAQNLSDLSYENVPITVNERSVSSNDGVTLEMHDKTIIANKLAFRLYPANADVELKANAGLIEPSMTTLISARDTLSFNSENEKTASRYINELVWTGNVFLYDENYNDVIPGISVSGGKIVLSQKCTGNITIDYKTTVKLFNYTPATGGVWGNKKQYGRVVAFNKRKKLFAALDMSIPGGDKNRYDAIVVYKKVLAQNDKLWELPTTWPNDNTYAGYPSLTDSEKPEIGVGGVNQDVRHVVYVEDDEIYEDMPLVTWNRPSPTKTTPLNGVKWEINVNIPTPGEGDSTYVYDQLIAKEAALRALYNIQS
jgi:hypothetical protein